MGGLDLAFSRVAGSPARKSSLVIAHGLLGNSNNWNMVGSKLMEHRHLQQTIGTLFKLDMRNHGKSRHCPRHSCEYMASDIENFVLKNCVSEERLRGHQSIIVGHSMGGIAVMHSLLRQWNREQCLAIPGSVSESMKCVPEGANAYRDLCVGEKTTGTVAAAVIVDSAPFPQHPRERQSHLVSLMEKMLALPLDEVKTTKQASAWLAGAGITAPGMRDFVMTNLAFDDSGHCQWKCNLKVLYEQFEKIGFPAMSFQKKCEIPVLCVFGGQSPYSSDRTRALIEDYFDNVDHVIIPGAGHTVHYEQPDTFVEVVAPFIEEYMRS